MAKKLNDLLAEYGRVRDGLSDLKAQEKEYNAQKRELEAQISIRMQDEGLEKYLMVDEQSLLKQRFILMCKTGMSFKHIAETGRFELLQKRPSATAYREAISLGEEIPGLRARS